MRIIVYGLGAVGGAIAAALHHSGVETVGIARGAMLAAVQKTGLRLRAPAHDLTVPVRCVASPSEIEVQPSDVILLTMKTQDTESALHDLRAAGLAKQPIYCFQNGVANEQIALRYAPNVRGATVMMPAQYVVPGEVAVSVAPKFGMFDVGLYPRGTDETDIAVERAFAGANMSVYPTDDVMQSKFGKLRLNLANIIQAALLPGEKAPRVTQALRAEFDAVTEAMGQAWIDVGDDPRRMVDIVSTPVPGVDRIGGSTVQSFARGTGSVETDFLNGEVTLLGRLHGVPTPANERATELAVDLLKGSRKAGALTVAEVEEFVLQTGM